MDERGKGSKSRSRSQFGKKVKATGVGKEEREWRRGRVKE